MKEKVYELKKIEDELKQKKEKLDRRQKYVMDLFKEENKDLFEEVESLNEKYEVKKEEVEEQALNEFKDKGNKTLFGGIKIQERSKYVYDEKKALGWCKDNMPVAIIEKLDKKQFKTFIKNNDLDFVVKESKVLVTFPSKGLKVEE